MTRGAQIRSQHCRVPQDWPERKQTCLLPTIHLGSSFLHASHRMETLKHVCGGSKHSIIVLADKSSVFRDASFIVHHITSAITPSHHASKPWIQQQQKAPEKITGCTTKAKNIYSNLWQLTTCTSPPAPPPPTTTTIAKRTVSSDNESRRTERRARRHRCKAHAVDLLGRHAAAFKLGGVRA